IPPTRKSTRDEKRSSWRSPRSPSGMMASSVGGCAGGGGRGPVMRKPLVASVGTVSVMLLALAGVGCSTDVEGDATTSIESALSSAPADPVPCAAWADAVVANTGNVLVGASTLVDSYQSSLGAYGGTNVGSA